MLLAAASAVAAVPRPGEHWRVLGVFPSAVYLGGPRRRVLPLVSADGLLLPNAWRLPAASAALAWGVGPGETVPVGVDGALRLGPHRVRAVRSWHPRPVRRTERAHREWDARSWVGGRIGLGEGLTPEGDDEICGALLVAHSVGDRRLAGAVEPLLARTTDLSAALLRCAGAGLAVPQLTAFVNAVTAGDDRLAERLRPAVLAIGHSSGPALVRGVEEALATLTEGVLLRA